MSSNLVRIGVTHGDINGVGYEVILKTFADIRIVESCIITVYGSTKVASYHRKAMELQPVTFNAVASAADAVVNKINILNCCSEDLKVEIGKSTESAGEAAFQALEKATADLKEGLIDVLVTAPINKLNIQRGEFHFPGHTEYLEEKFSVNGSKSLMILANETLRVALVTGHLPLAEVAGALTKDKIKSTLRIFNKSLQRDFGIQKPRIAVLSLNPHAGEKGLLGSEEAEIITPALQEIDNEKILAFGPFAADGFFGSGSFARFDGIVAMYHDQGLIPFKTLAMENGVNFTAGLPVVRTSPAHGTGYDIAGKNEASEESFRQAIYMGIDVFKKRKWFDEASANPLKKMYFEKNNGKDETVDLTKDEPEILV
jgi:4-hydroxythreonine-4-phosphate dehydrogenase